MAAVGKVGLGSGEFLDALRPHLGAAARVARRFAPADDADDVVQDALLAAWRHRDRFDPGRGSFGAWLLAIVVTECRKAGGRRRRRNRLVARLAREPMPGAGRLVGLPQAGSANDAALEAAIARLSRRQREVMGLYYFVDLSLEQVAAVLGLSPGTVKSTLADARAQIRRLLDIEE